MDNQMRVALSPPWETYVHELTAMFKNDEDVKVLYDRDNDTVKLFVDNQAKADALTEILNDKLNFGGAELNVEVVPSDRKVVRGGTTPWFTAFRDNLAMKDVKTVTYPFGTLTYVIWSLKPVQFFNDNLGDYYANKTMLLEDVARDIFKPLPGVCHCSEKYEDLLH